MNRGTSVPMLVSWPVRVAHKIFPIIGTDDLCKQGANRMKNLGVSE
jgi:hypothetical protein